MLFYHSLRLKDSLMAYSQTEMRQSAVRALEVSEATGGQASVFEVKLPPQEGLEFLPQMFAAANDEDRARWLAEFERIQREGRTQL